MFGEQQRQKVEKKEKKEKKEKEKGGKKEKNAHRDITILAVAERKNKSRKVVVPKWFRA